MDGGRVWGVHAMARHGRRYASCEILNLRFRVCKAQTRILLPMKFDGCDLPAWVAGQKLNLRRQARRQLDTLMLEKRIQLAFQPAVVNPLSRPKRSKAGA